MPPTNATAPSTPRKFAVHAPAVACGAGAVGGQGLTCGRKHQQLDAGGLVKCAAQARREFWRRSRPAEQVHGHAARPRASTHVGHRLGPVRSSAKTAAFLRCNFRRVDHEPPARGNSPLPFFSNPEAVATYIPSRHAPARFTGRGDPTAATRAAYAPGTSPPRIRAHRCGRA